jgi:hypothetical protein
METGMLAVQLIKAHEISDPRGMKMENGMACSDFHTPWKSLDPRGSKMGDWDASCQIRNGDWDVGLIRFSYTMEISS